MKNNLDNKHNKEPNQKIFEERLKKLFELIEKSSEWKKNYEYFQRASDVTENSIRVSET
ncbi:MAG: hypothetical protein PHC28_06895 [Flavobacterium sp.]|uniref:hypothetical protein n=1 Tax=Flavobacterium sp. TaxID=239 RepID=UPI00260B5378|nr:hypothetical protein [Flavobacterium sp.]MDD5150197.1 hypothetical protein [Flavobacterium sp.]